MKNKIIEDNSEFKVGDYIEISSSSEKLIRQIVSYADGVTIVDIETGKLGAYKFNNIDELLDIYKKFKIYKIEPVKGFIEFKRIK